MDALGDILGPAALTIAKLSQAPQGMVAQSLLAAATLAAQGLADVEVDGRRYPISNFFLTIAASGERKSTVNEVALAPIIQRQSELLNIYNKATLAGGQLPSGRRRRKAAIRPLPDRALIIGGGAAPIPVMPIMLWQDVTYDGISQRLYEGHASTGTFADEGGTFVGGHSMSAEQMGRTAGGLCKLWDGELATLIRKRQSSIGHRGCRFTMHLMMQPEVASQLISKRILWAQGLFPRCLMVEVVGLAGTRNYVAQDVLGEPSVQTYHRNISKLIQAELPLKAGSKNELSPPTMTLTKEAKVEWTKFFNQVEKRMAEGEVFAAIRSSASRAPEHVLRLAAVMTLVSEPTATTISSGTIRNACVLVRYYLGQSRRLSGVNAPDKQLVLANRVLDWLQSYGPRSNFVVPLTDIYQRGPAGVRTVSYSMAIMQILIEHGWVRKRLVKGVKCYEVRPAD